MNKTKIRQPPDTGGFYYRNDLWFSKAFQELTKSSKNLLHSLINELKWSRNNYSAYFKANSKRGYSGVRDYINNGELSFSEAQYKALYNSSSETYIKSRNQLIKNGLIIQTYRGGYGKGDRSRYKLLCLRGMPLGEQRWRKYPNKNWESDIPRMKIQSVGKNTRFKKGQSGRKLISTLTKHTLTEQNNPTKSNPRE